MGKKKITILLAGFLLCSILAGQSLSETEFFDKTDHFFSTYVFQGKVDYSSLAAADHELVFLTGQLARPDLADAGSKPIVYKALLINAYNLFVIKGVIDHYPVKSPMDVPGFFDRLQFDLFGKKVTLNQIENNLLRKKYPDAGLHFVLVCGAESCPPIISRAYRPETLKQQITTQTRLAMENNNFLWLDHNSKKVMISEIFKWYKQDFDRDGGSVIQYINKFRSTKLPAGYKTDFYKYNWALNIKKKQMKPDAAVQTGSNVRIYTPAKLLKKNQFEIKLFNNFYTQTAYRDNDGTRVELNSRSTYYTALVQILYGISASAKINLGFDINFKSVRQDPDPGSSFLSVLNFSAGATGRTAIASFGPKIKIAPFTGLGSFSIQTGFWIPGASDLEGMDNGRPFLDYDRYTWNTQFFFDKNLGRDFSLFLQTDLLVRIPKKFDFSQADVVVPVSIFLSYFPVKNGTVYGMVQYSPTLTMDSTYYAQAGLGGKYQLTRTLELEVSWTYFFASANAGAGATYNLGFRYLK